MINKKKYKFIYPSLLLLSNEKYKVNTNSWFDILKSKNTEIENKKEEINVSEKFINSLKIKLSFEENHIIKLKKNLDGCTNIYNFANEYIKKNVTNENFKEEVNFYKLRKILKDKIKKICKEYELNKHTGDYAVKHCIEMYKSAFSNHKDINKFEIKNLENSRRRKNMVIEPTSLKVKNKGSIYFSFLKSEIKSSVEIEKINKNSLLQYDSIKKIFWLIVPYDDEINKIYEKNEKCGIDIGIRTFLTTYSPERSYEIGTKETTYKNIDMYNKKIDSIKSRYEKKEINKKSYENGLVKYYDRIRNKINDMHSKVANFLLGKYKTILIGKVSTKNMVSTEGDMYKKTKRRLNALSHYRFRTKLINMSKKFGTEIKLVSEYMTSKTCHNCLEINRDLRFSKIFECKKCKINIDRDVNASINIYKDIKLKK